MRGPAARSPQPRGSAALQHACHRLVTCVAARRAGVAFTLDALYPSRPLLPGLGRNFLSRSMLDAASVQAALDLLQLPDQVGGGVVVEREGR